MHHIGRQPAWATVMVAGLASALLGCEKRELAALEAGTAPLGTPGTGGGAAATSPVEVPPVRAETRLGVTLQTFSPGLARSLGITSGAQGAVVSGVIRPGDRPAAGLSVGDLIEEIDGIAIATADEAMALLQARRSKDLVLRVRNTQGTRLVTVPGR